MTDAPMRPAPLWVRAAAATVPNAPLGRYRITHALRRFAGPTALLEVDLRRFAAECGIDGAEVRFTCSGRIPLTPFHCPRGVSRMWPSGLSDNVVLAGRTNSARGRRGA